MRGISFSHVGVALASIFCLFLFHSSAHAQFSFTNQTLTGSAKAQGYFTQQQVGLNQTATATGSVFDGTYFCTATDNGALSATDSNLEISGNANTNAYSNATDDIFSDANLTGDIGFSVLTPASYILTFTGTLQSTENDDDVSFSFTGTQSGKTVISLTTPTVNQPANVTLGPTLVQLSPNIHYDFTAGYLASTDDFDFAQSATIDATLVAVPVPEPASLTIFAMAGLGLLRRRRR